MSEVKFKALLDRLKKQPDDRVTWAYIAQISSGANKNLFLNQLKQDPYLLKEFMHLLESDQQISAAFKLSLNEIEDLESFMENVDVASVNTDSETADNITEPTSIEAPTNPVPNHQRSPALKDIDEDLADILGDSDLQRKVPEDEDLEDFRKTLDELQGKGSTDELQERKSQYKDLVSRASAKAYAYDDDDINEAIMLYEHALRLDKGTAIDWYNFGQLFLRRAQKKVGIFAYSFEGKYRDVSDYYRALDASKRAVQLDPKDNVYWQNLTTVYEIMNKKPMALFCAKKSLEISIEQEKRLSSGILGPSTTKDSSIDILQSKIETLSGEVETEIDPFDESAVTSYENATRKDKLANGLLLDHIELLEEAKDRLASGDSDGALQLLHKATDIKPNFAEAWVLQASIKFDLATATTDRENQKLEFADVTQLAERAIEIDPGSIAPYKILARQYEYLDARDDYIRVLERIIELEPENWEYRKKISDVYFEKGLNFHIYGDSIQADHFLSKAITLYPFDAKTWAWQGKNRILKEDYTGAITAFLESLRLESTNPAAEEGLVEAYYLQAKVHNAAGDYALAIDNLNEIFKRDPDNINARGLLEQILDNYCEEGFNALDSNDLEFARGLFEKTLAVDHAYPYAWFGMVRYHIISGDMDMCLDAAVNALESCTRDMVNFADEFVVQTVMDMIDAILQAKPESAEKMAIIASLFREFFDGFMNLIPFIRANKIFLGQVHADLFKFFLEKLARYASEGDLNAMKVLEVFGATDLPAHVSQAGTWQAAAEGVDQQVEEGRKLVLFDMKAFFDKLFNLFVYRCNSSNPTNITLFITYLTEQFFLSIKEIYAIISFVENGAHVSRMFDTLAKTRYVITEPLGSESIAIVNLPKAALALVSNPAYDVIGLIAKDSKLGFVNASMEQLESAVYTGKATKLHADELKWSPDGKKAIVIENKEGGKIAVLDFSLDPMVSKDVDILSVNPEQLAGQIATIELDQPALVAGWKDEAIPQALLRDGHLVRWTIDQGEITQKGTHVAINPEDMVALSPSQELVAILSRETKALVYINLRSDKVFEFAFCETAEPLAVKWDTASLMAHVLLRGKENLFTVIRGEKDGGMKTALQFTEPWLDTGFFEVLSCGTHVFYLFRSGKKFILFDDEDSFRIDFPIDPSAKVFLEKDPLAYQWIAMNEFRCFLDGPMMVVVNFSAMMKQLILDHIAFLNQFPATAFIEKSAMLEAMYEILP